MTRAKRVMLTITHLMSWRRSSWSESVPTRQAWLVTCPEHPKFGRDNDGEPWGYATAGIARGTAARHGNAFHSWPRQDHNYDVLEIEEEQL